MSKSSTLTCWPDLLALGHNSKATQASFPQSTPVESAPPDAVRWKAGFWHSKDGGLVPSAARGPVWCLSKQHNGDIFSSWVSTTKAKLVLRSNMGTGIPKTIRWPRSITDAHLEELTFPFYFVSWLVIVVFPPLQMRDRLSIPSWRIWWRYRWRDASLCCPMTAANQRRRRRSTDR